MALITLCAQSAFSETLTSQESDRIAKEDIAATQVLAEVCPVLIGNNPAFQTKIENLNPNLIKGSLENYNISAASTRSRIPNCTERSTNKCQRSGSS